VPRSAQDTGVGTETEVLAAWLDHFGSAELSLDSVKKLQLYLSSGKTSEAEEWFSLFVVTEE